MNPPQWGIVVLLVVGVLIIGAGWWWDARRNRRAAEGFITEEDLQSHGGPTTLSDADLTLLLGARGPEPTLPGGVADREFLTHPLRGVAAVRDPIVVVTDAELDDERLILTILDAARNQGRPLVLVAPTFGFGLLGTLRANLLTDRVATLPIELSDPDLLARAAALCGTIVVPEADLRSGWLPDPTRGTAVSWVADIDDSWVTAPGHPGRDAGSADEG